jgi:DnaJ domain
MGPEGSGSRKRRSHTCRAYQNPDLSPLPFLSTSVFTSFHVADDFCLQDFTRTMPSSTARAIFGLIGWSYIPDFVTSTLVRWARPYLRTPVTPLHYRLTFTLVVLSYLTYNFFEASLSTPPNFYELLDVSPASDEVKLKAAFRSFARKYHPDRVGPEGADLFVAVREGYEALMEPNKRWAYDR